MNGASRWPRTLVIVGLVAMVIGLFDPLEGAFVILPGIGLVALGARLGNSRHRILLYCSFVMVAVGVGTLWGLSALGGFGGNSGRSNWWALALLPYPAVGSWDSSVPSGGCGRTPGVSCRPRNDPPQ